MRIVAGTWRGRSFEAPEGRGTRPTTDRMRESIASSIMSAYDLDLGGCSVLDAFAGSGGVGLELLSRGAQSCCFCERDRRAAALVRANVRIFGLGRDRAAVVCGDVFRLATQGSLAGAPFDIVFLDPPYATDAGAVSELVNTLNERGLLATGATVVYERGAGAAGLVIEGFEELRSRKHGSTCVDLLRLRK